MRYYFNAKLIILAFFLLRLYGITNPPLEINHNWRQATTNMYARNFLEVDNNPFYCRVDMAGELSGITAKEFPLYNYLIYLTAEVFGWRDWYGRLINLLVSSLGLWFFFLLVKKYVSPLLKNLSTEQPSLELMAMVVLMASIWFGHSRIIMPDTFSVSLVLAGLWYGLEWLYRGGAWRLLLFGLLATLGVLSKMPSGFLLASLVFPILDRTILAQRKIGLLAMGALLIGASGWWYFSWLPHVVETYGFEHYPMRSVTVGFQEIMSDLPEVAERFWRSALKSYIGFGLYLLGLGIAVYKKEWRLIGLFALLSLVFLGYMFKSGASFYHHNYYIIPFVPVMAVLVAYAIARVKYAKWKMVLLLAVAIEAIANQQDAFRIKKTELPKLKLEAIADSLSQRSDLVAFYTENGNPQEIYFSHRKGWLVNAPQIGDQAYLRELANRGCKYLFISKKQWEQWPKPSLELVFEDEHYWVFVLHQ